MENEIRRTTENGQEYLIVPTALGREKIYDYSDQPIDNDSEFLPAEELGRAASTFDNKPINIEHPFVPSGNGVTFGSINDPMVINKRIVGESRNPRLNGETLWSDSWLKVDEQTFAENPEYAAAVKELEEENKAIPVSPGYQLGRTTDDADSYGVRADGVQRDLKGDHVAITLTSNPRCTISEGCSIGGEVMDQLARASSDLDTRPAVGEALRINAPIGSEELDMEDEQEEERSNASIGDLGSGDKVSWSASGGTAYGVVKKTVGEDGTLDSEIDGDQTINGPAVLIEVYRPGSDGWEKDDTQVGHKPDSLSKIGSFPDRSNATIDEESVADGVFERMKQWLGGRGNSEDIMEDEITDDERVENLVEAGIDRENAEALRGTDCIEQIDEWRAERANAEEEPEDPEDDDPEDPEDDDDPEDVEANDDDPEEETEEIETDMEEVEIDYTKLAETMGEELDLVQRSDLDEQFSTYQDEYQNEQRRTELKDEIVANSELPRSVLSNDIDSLETTRDQVTESEESEEDSATDYSPVTTQRQRLNAMDDDEVDMSLAKDYDPEEDED